MIGNAEKLTLTVHGPGNFTMVHSDGSYVPYISNEPIELVRFSDYVKEVQETQNKINDLTLKVQGLTEAIKILISMTKEEQK